MLTKSAERMLGLMRTVTLERTEAGARRMRALEQLDEHRVGAVAVRPQLHGVPVAVAQVERVADDAGEHLGGVDAPDAGDGREAPLSDDAARLGEMRRARHVGQRVPRGASGCAADSSSSAWSATSSGDVARRPCASAPRGGDEERRAPCTGRRAGCGRSARRRCAPIARPSSPRTSMRGVDRGEGLPDELGARGDDLVGDEGRAAGERLGREQCCLAAGTGAEVEPALARRDGARAAEGERGELATPRPARARAPRRTAGSDAGSPRSARRTRSARSRVRVARARRRLGEAGQGDEAHARRRVVGSRGVIELVGAPLALQSRPERTHDPDGMRRARCARRSSASVAPASTQVAPLLPASLARCGAARALMKPSPIGRRPRGRARPSRRPRRAAGTRIASSWWAPSRSTSSTAGSIRATSRPAAEAMIRVVEPAPAQRAVGELRREPGIGGR